MSGLVAWLLALLSTASVLVLARHDRKRQRTLPRKQALRELSAWQQRILLAGALGPGLLLLALAHWSALMIWSGLVPTLSWLAVLALAAHSARPDTAATD